jgi:L-alanine-DL-glutamate epimerase-like enolase superfamily enzyme
MPVTLAAKRIDWELREPFRIARSTMTAVSGIVATLTDDNGLEGRGEAYGVGYEGETVESMLDQVARLRACMPAELTREWLLESLPHGGARCAIDCALWDLEAKRSGVAAWRRAGIPRWQPVVSAFTIGMRDRDELIACAAAHADFALLKVKVGAEQPLEAIATVHSAAPQARLIVDANQAWSFEALERYAPRCLELGVVLLEQPIAAELDAPLLEYESPVPICADEAVRVSADLPRVCGKYDYVNIKLDKAGGLTAALELAHAARQQGFGLMVGCMAGSSLAMAPAAVVAQLCEFVDLDGPLLQRDDWPHGLQYERGVISRPQPLLWG